MKLNRRGYIAVEIILASIVSITIAVFLIDITIRLVNRTDNNYIDTIFVSDKALLTKNIKEEIENDISNKGVIDSISCSNSNCNIIFNDRSSKELSIEGNKVTYGSYTKEVDKRLGGEVKVNSSISDDNKYIIINITFTNIFDDSDYSVIVPISNIESKCNEEITSTPIAEYITNLYKNASKSTVTNNSITYNYTSGESLMNDRLGGTTTSLDGGNIRYYGASPNNYIYFNCTDYSNQTSDTCELWRIIGVFDGRVKIIRNNPIGGYSWDTSDANINDGLGVNEWSQADLMKLLNPGYESELVGGSLYYNSKSGKCYRDASNSSTSCDFTSSGIKNDETKNKIATTTWYTGGYDIFGYNNPVYSNEIYKSERASSLFSGTTCSGGTCNDGITRKASWNGKVAVPYPSDYGYATDFDKCSKGLNEYDDSTNSYACRNNDWIYELFFNRAYKSHVHLLNPSNACSYHNWGVSNEGDVDSGWVNKNKLDVYPTLFLNSDEVRDECSDGTIDNPYRIK